MFEQISKPPNSITLEAIMHTCKKIKRVCLRGVRPEPSQLNTIDQSWKPPRAPLYKVNFDGAVFREQEYLELVYWCGMKKGCS